MPENQRIEQLSRERHRHTQPFNTPPLSEISQRGSHMSTTTPPAETKPPETDVTRYKVRLIAEGQGEAEGELIRFTSPMTVDNLEGIAF